MEVLKCLMCGGELELTENSSICKCKFCGSMQTLPREKNDNRVNAYNRANHLFRNNEFDKAMAIYENILLDDPEDANAYWSCILCKYGVTYVEDPATKERMITVNRTQNEPVETDELFKSAMEFATAEQKELFTNEARKIDDIQKGIIEISQNEKPFDVFISYKETDPNGERTIDSVLATDLYYGLTDAGFKVFLSRITLEDKLGHEYEPYIYAAINSAKVMIVLGTKREYFEAPWVKNEWSRYLKIMKKDRKKIVIPAYRDMDPYDLPAEFALLQSQDMSKIGFLQDIVRGVKKVIGSTQPKPAEKIIEKTIVKEASASAGATNNEVANLIQRIKIFIDGDDWNSASQYIERALDKAPLEAELYALKAQTRNKLKSIDDIVDSGLTSDNNLDNAIKFATGEYKVRLENIRDIMVRHTEEAEENRRRRQRELEEERIAREAQEKALKEKRNKYDNTLNGLTTTVNSISTNLDDLKKCNKNTEDKIKEDANKSKNNGVRIKKAAKFIIISIACAVFGLVMLTVASSVNDSDSAIFMAGIPLGMLSIIAAIVLEIMGKFNYFKYIKGDEAVVGLILALLGEYFSIGIYAIYLDVQVFKKNSEYKKNSKKIEDTYAVYSDIVKGLKVDENALRRVGLSEYVINKSRIQEAERQLVAAKDELEQFKNNNDRI